MRRRKDLVFTVVIGRIWERSQVSSLFRLRHRAPLTKALSLWHTNRSRSSSIMDLEEAYSELIKSDDSALRTASPPTYRSVSVAFCDALILPKPPVAAKLQQIPEISKPQGEGRPSPVDRPSAHEYTYDPIVRYNALNRLFREPRGDVPPCELVFQIPLKHLETLLPILNNFGKMENTEDGR